MQSQGRARAHVEHSFVAFPVDFHPHGIDALLQCWRGVGLHVGGRESELASVFKSVDDGSGEVHGNGYWLWVIEFDY